MVNSAALRLFDGNDAHAASYFSGIFKMPRITGGAQLDNDAQMGGLDLLDMYSVIEGSPSPLQGFRYGIILFLLLTLKLRQLPDYCGAQEKDRTTGL